VATFAIGKKVAQKKGRQIKGQTLPRRCLILEIALFERRSNARAEYAAEYLGPRDRDRATASESGPGIKHNRDSTISRPDRAITTIGRSKFVCADRVFGSPRASVSTAPVSPPLGSSSS